MTIADVAQAIEVARTYALPGKEAVAIADVMFELRELIWAQIIEFKAARERGCLS